ncbi:MAG: hypothetical protein ACRCZ0_08275 [Cetobacterium sp.]
MVEVMSFIYSRYIEYIYSLVICFALYVLYIYRAKLLVRTFIKGVILEADKCFKSGEGKLKLQFAIRAFINKLPKFFRYFMTEALVIKTIECVLGELKSRSEKK